MTVSKTLTSRVYKLVIVLGFANGALWANEFPPASSASVHFPLLPEAALRYSRDGLARRRRIRVVKQDDHISFFTKEKPKEEEEDEGEDSTPEKTETTENSDEGEKEKSTEEGEEENQRGPGREESVEEDTGSEAGETARPVREEGMEQDTEGESGEGVKASEGEEKEEEKESVEAEDVFISQQLPEPSTGVADAQEACDSMHCSRVVGGAGSKAKITGCSRAIKCAECRSKLDPEERCTAWKPPSRSTITLATGWSVSKVKLIPGSALNLPIKWDTQDAFEDDKCLPDTKQVSYAYDKVNQTGNVEKFPFTRVLNVQLAIYSTPIEGTKETRKTPQMVYSIEVTDPFPWNEVVPGGGSHQSSPRCHQSLQTLPNVQIRGQSAVFGVGWFSVLKDKAHTLSPTNVGVRVQCIGTKSCNMKKYAVCVRVTCPPTAASAERQMAAGLDAMKKPVGNIPTNVTQHAGPTGGIEGGEGGEEDQYAMLPWNFNVWAYAQRPGWSNAWKSEEARTAIVFNLAVALLTLISAALDVE